MFCLPFFTSFCSWIRSANKIVGEGRFDKGLSTFSTFSTVGRKKMTLYVPIFRKSGMLVYGGLFFPFLFINFEGWTTLNVD